MAWRAAYVGLVLAAACGSGDPARTSDELRSAIAAYDRGDAGVTDDRIGALFARLDAEVATMKAQELEKPPDQRAELTARRTAIEAERRDLQVAFLHARAKRLGVAVDDALKGLGEQLGKGLEDAGRALRESMHREGTP